MHKCISIIPGHFWICCVRFANLSDLLIMLLKSYFTKGGEKFSWGEPTEAKNPKNKEKIRKKFSFSKGTPFAKALFKSVIRKSDTTYI